MDVLDEGTFMAQRTTCRSARVTAGAPTSGSTARIGWARSSALMITQSFLYNAIFFTYALVLTKFYHVSNNDVPLYGLAFAVGNLAGPLILGHLFDTIGRKKMISGTYLISGVMLAFSAWLFDAGVLHAAAQTSSGSSCSSSRPPGRALVTLRSARSSRSRSGPRRSRSSSPSPRSSARSGPRSTAR
jgi:MFS family permease